MLKYGTISPEDLTIIKITDDPNEVLTIINKHRQWKLKRIREAKGRKIRKKKGD